MEADLLRALVLDRKAGVLALQSGGCAKYLLSRRVHYCLDRDGCPLLRYDSDNAHRQHLFTHSTMALTVDYERDDDGTVHSQLVLVGQMEPVTNDPDALDRYHSFYPDDGGDGSNEHWGLHRFQVVRAHVALESGELNVVRVVDILPRNPLRADEERRLRQQLSARLRGASRAPDAEHAQRNTADGEVVGVDGLGYDIRVDGQLHRRNFARPVTSAQEARALFDRLCTASATGATPHGRVVQEWASRLPADEGRAS